MQRSALAVKKLILTATGFLCLAGGLFLLNTGWGQDRKPPKEPAEDVPHRVGLIDIGYVFQKYEKLTYELTELSAEMKEAETRWRAKQQKGVELQNELRDFTEDSPEFESRRNKLLKMSTDLEAERKLANMDFQKKRAKLLHTAYLEVQDAVEKFCNHHKFTVIISFNRSDPSSTDPQRVNQLLASPVVYHRKRDDLTQGVLDYLNQKYLKSAGGEGKQITDKENKAAAPKPTKKDKDVIPAGGTGK
jgi:Skp family chaperone for outer membrane proteins